MAKPPQKLKGEPDRKGLMLQAALQYADRGWRVFPLTGKRPLVQGGYKSASCDPEQIHRWWSTEFPGSNIGVACDGEFWALDLDAKHDGADTLKELEVEHGPFPETVRSITGGGGRHFLFRNRGVEIKNSTGTAGPGLDTRSDGYIVLPPSIHPQSKKQYEWEAGHSPGDIKIAEAPQWLITLCSKSSPPLNSGKRTELSTRANQSTPLGARALERACGKILLAPDGEQETTLNATAFLLGRLAAAGQIKFDEAEQALCVAGSGMTSFNPTEPWLSKDIESKISAAMGDGYEAPLNDFERGDKGVPLAHQDNIRLALAYLGVSVWHDEFNDRSYFDGIDGTVANLDDANAVSLWLLLDDEFGLRPKKDYFFDVLSNEARKNARHPVTDFFESLSWDGVARLDRWLVDYGGAEASEYVLAVSALPFLAAVRRVGKPGTKFDEMLILEGTQGTGKSTALRILAVSENWFSDDLPLGVDAQKTIERTRGKLIVEAGELRGMRKNDVENLKAFLSRSVDRARMAYGRFTAEVPRQFVIIGTTNSEQYLRDSTGNRRFLPVRTGEFDLEGLREARDQLWAEAVVREGQGESIRLSPKHWSDAAEEQRDRYSDDPLVGAVREVLGEMEGRIKGDDVLKLLGVAPGQRTQEHNNRLGESMKALGWEKRRLRHQGAPEYFYVKGNAARRILIAEDGTANYESAPGHEDPM